MLVSDLDYVFPNEAIALEPSRPTRVAFQVRGQKPLELNLPGLLEKFERGDILVINESRVIPARVFSATGVEILFLRSISENPSENYFRSSDQKTWEVLFPAREHVIGDKIALPGDVNLTLKQKGLPQLVETSVSLPADYFERYGEMALPPYIQEMRGERHERGADREWYQPKWANVDSLATGVSVAAPTASLHFQNSDLETLRLHGVKIAKVILNVGAGTFLPVKTQTLAEHKMHAESVQIPAETLELVRESLANKKRVWALGTTVTRALESIDAGLLRKAQDGSFVGETRLLIFPPYSFQVVGGLLTNFHQPRSTLLALVSAFAGLDQVKTTYAWAIERRFKLFSYGDLSAWI